MTAEAMANVMSEIIARSSSPSLPELIREVGPQAEGDLDCVSGTDPNIILWHHVSDTFIEALSLLLDQERAYLHPVSPLTLLNSPHLVLPLVKRPPKNGYRDPHWLPVVLSPRPPQ